MRSYFAIGTLLLAASCGSVSSLSNDGGKGGSTGGSSCDQIQVAYAAALAVARACSVDGSNQCQKIVASQLGCNGCPTFVNDDSGFSQYENAWNQASCGQNQGCLAIACVSPKEATCKASDAGGATCVDSFLAAATN